MSSGRSAADPLFFATPDELRSWLAEHHATERELWVGLHKKGSGRPSVSWPQLVDELLCFGWIDGVRKSVDETSYAIRVTPRRPGSIWRAVNLRRAAELLALGRMDAAGRAVWEARDPEKTGRYSFERQAAALRPADEAVLRAEPAAWEFFQAQPPSYRKTAIWWVASARREETRQWRLAKLVAASAAGRRIGP